MDTNSVLKAVRTELGDLLEPFRDSFRGDGNTVNWDLGARNVIESSVKVVRIDTSVQPPTVDEMDPMTEYMLNPTAGEITFISAPDETDFIRVEGNNYGIYTDEELLTFVNAAVGQHLHGRVTTRRYRDGNGFIKYDREQMTLSDMPHEEEVLVVLLSTIEALWALATDAALDIDVQTAEGTSIPRTQRFRQITAQIDLLTDKYKELSGMMGVGLFAIEVLDLRRVSRTTGRYVPVFQSKEYDEVGPPIRKTLPVNTRNSDPDGPASPWFSGIGGN